MLTASDRARLLVGWAEDNLAGAVTPIAKAVKFHVPFFGGKPEAARLWRTVAFAHLAIAVRSALHGVAPDQRTPIVTEIMTMSTGPALNSMHRKSPDFAQRVPKELGFFAKSLHENPPARGLAVLVARNLDGPSAPDDSALRPLVAILQQRIDDADAVIARALLDRDGPNFNVEDVARTLHRDEPQRDAVSGLPTTIEIVVVDTPAGAIPTLRWGPVETRRPGWTGEHQKKMARELITHITSLGIRDPDRIQELCVEVWQLSDQVWSTAVKAMVEASNRNR